MKDKIRIKLKGLLGFGRPYKSKRSRTYIEIDYRRHINDTLSQNFTNFLANGLNIFGGSRLPKNPKALLDQGWEELFDKRNKTGLHQKYHDKMSNQIVEFHKAQKGLNGFRGVDHYHWINQDSIMKKMDTKFDKYGRPCKNGSKPSHILPIVEKKK